ncbi:hypothetical protein SAMN05421854_106364 [Amycolatopsis rubida]|uniref:Uncharacterized protein n=1 Tax=Amycolatopsis rubida TaxID=112413 RepID=A0A1I5SLX7_9PSEU|nr:hypothetical protein SAMN05421854_106364 [Amycolatopsis rubida]
MPRPLRLFNSSVPAFLCAFGRIDTSLGDLSHLPPDRSLGLAEELRTEFTAPDPQSMVPGGTHWPDYLDEVPS